MNEHFNELVSRMRDNQGRNLVSIIVYGSAVADSGNNKKADYQVLIITHRLSANDLRQARRVVGWWTGEGYTIPVFFTVKELQDSLDVYPIEFRHMKRAYLVIYGEDLLAGKDISKSNLRWQTEHELRGKLLRLRSLYLPASLSKDELTRLMTDSVVSFVRVMRPLLEIAGEEPPVSRLETVKRVGERLNIDTSAVARVLHLRYEPNKMMDIESQDLFASYLECLERLIDQVNSL
jgi:hypothetical protein